MIFVVCATSHKCCIILECETEQSAYIKEATPRSGQEKISQGYTPIFYLP